MYTNYIYYEKVYNIIIYKRLYYYIFELPIPPSV